MPKKERWEEIYDQYKNEGDINLEELEKDWRAKDNDYRNQLKEIIDSNSEEYRKINADRKKVEREFINKMNNTSKYKAIKKNETKIEKIKNDRDVWQEVLDELLSYRAENERLAQDIMNLEAKRDELEKELEELKFHEKHLKIALNNPEVSDVLEENIEKQNINQSSFSKNQLALQEKKNIPVKEYSEEEIEELEEKIDRCNKICEMLVEGKTMAEIQASLKDQKGEDKKGEDKKGEDKKGEDKKGEDKKGEDKKGEDKKGGDQKGGDQKGGDQKGGDQKGGDQKGGDQKGGDQKGGDQKGGEQNGGDQKGGEQNGGDQKGGLPKDTIRSMNIEFDAKSGEYVVKALYDSDLSSGPQSYNLDELLKDEKFQKFYEKFQEEHPDAPQGVDPHIAYIISNWSAKNKEDLLEKYISSLSEEGKKDDRLYIEYNMSGIYGRKYSPAFSDEMMDIANRNKEKEVAEVYKGLGTRILEKSRIARNIWERFNKIGAKEFLALPKPKTVVNFRKPAEKSRGNKDNFIPTYSPEVMKILGSRSVEEMQEELAWIDEDELTVEEKKAIGDRMRTLRTKAPINDEQEKSIEDVKKKVESNFVGMTGYVPPKKEGQDRE